ncbi:MAG: formylmethanofuran dehydrogenase subunit C [Methanomicrobiales archaeon HGW-Methanomicrobiales-4]|nr:MAG: formylmethanofuran dehydrogenase subunit C [Methanomicrobiales archaeon HGW-Methanomicrobiales-4]
MDIIKLIPSKAPELYLETEHISPDVFAGKTNQQIGEMHVHMGNQTYKLSDYFTIEGKAGATAADTKILVAGDVSKVKYIGMKMSAGEIEVLGNADMYVGAWMTGGKLVVKGNVDSFAGIAMTGGELIIEGNAKNYIGAAYRGDWRGMQGGKLVVKGNVGSDVGSNMNGGTIEIGGNADVHLATHIDGGKIIVGGVAKGRVGGQMVKGEIYVLGGVERMMPSFKYDHDEEVELCGKKMNFQVYLGDLGERHGKRKGEIIYGKIFIATGAVETAEEAKPGARSERRAKLNDKQVAQLAEAVKAMKEPNVQEVRAYIYENFDLDFKPMQVSRLIDSLKR